MTPVTMEYQLNITGFNNTKYAICFNNQFLNVTKTLHVMKPGPSWGRLNDVETEFRQET
jgi:hypothetical protein